MAKQKESVGMEQNSNMESQLRTIRKELDGEFLNILSNELSSLEQISGFLESVEQKLEKHYASAFPKKCRTCGKVYNSKDEYISETESVRKNNGVVFDEVGLQEFRNCTCGSTLVVWTKDRRDLTSYGVERRQLFDECLKKLTDIWLTSKKQSEPLPGYGILSEKSIRAILRDLFARSC